MTADGARTLIWDGANRLGQVVNAASATIDFAYGPDGKRACKVGAGSDTPTLKTIPSIKPIPTGIGFRR
ncbi:hypothetical protein [Hoeflea poritis]|uniref:YD repeat-containing protein n=1 Tax=Hoeflea poritis TaxID=2993659 RepID=A0ABT4VVY5_9HYPH|nr:hypothetical protein [Hoeflea poritis]MDA4848355.1 hypothetical protein [Hoeflea poritis]